MRAAELWIDGQRRYRRIPAISAALVRGDATVWAKGFGTTDRAGRIPATPDTIYSICSISKLFTAVALMQQWERGTVALDAPIERYLPWARLADDPRDSVPITLRGLLTHSAGLPREADFPIGLGRPFPFPSAGPRGDSGADPALSPSTLAIFLGWWAKPSRRSAVRPMPIMSTPISGTGRYACRHPAQLYGQQMAVEARARSRGPRSACSIRPAAGFSVADLAKFASWTFRLASSGEEEVLHPSTLREMQRVHYISPDWETSWGLGFSVRQEGGTTVVGHGGACPGYRSVLMLAPSESMGVAVAMNAMDDPGGIARGIAALVKARGEAAPFDPVAGVDLADYAGVYSGQPWDSDFMLIPWAGGLTWLDPDAVEPARALWRLKPLGGDRFRVVTDKGAEREAVTFERDAAGQVRAIRRHANLSGCAAKLRRSNSRRRSPPNRRCGTCSHKRNTRPCRRNPRPRPNAASARGQSPCR